MVVQKPERVQESDDVSIEDLPEGWLLTSVGELFQIVGGGTPSTKIPEYWEGDIPWITSADIYGIKNIVPRRTINQNAIKNSAANLVPKGSIIVVTRVSLGRIAICDTPISFSQDCHALIPKTDSVDPKFALHYLSQAVQSFKNQSRGTTISGVTVNVVSSLPFLLPPLAEQQRIVARVETLLAHVNAARDRLSRVPLIMKKFRQAVLAAACSGKLTEGWREENPDIESGNQLIERIAGRDSHSTVPYDDDPPLSIPEIPDTWEWSRCFLLCDPERDITYGVIKLGAPKKGGIPTLRSSDVRWLHIDNSDIKTIDPNIASQYSRTFLKGGEIVITVRGSLGGVAIVPQSMAGYNISREVAVLPIRSDLDAKYFSYAIASIWSQNWLSEVTKGVAYTGFNIRDLKRLPLPLPPLAEQHEIVRRVGLLFERADAFDQEVVAASRRCERLTQAVLGKAFRGELAERC